MRYHLTAAGTVTKKQKVASVGEGLEQKGHCAWECSWYSHLWERIWRFFKKLKVQLPYDRAILLLGIDPQEMKSVSYKAILLPDLLQHC